MTMPIDEILLAIAKLDYVDQQSLSTFLIDLVHTQERMKQGVEDMEKKEAINHQTKTRH